MVKSFDVTYDDFSGGHFIARVGTKQARTTFDGANVGVCQTDGTLVPLKGFFDATGALGGNTAANTSRPLSDPASGRIVWGGNTTLYAITNVGSSPPLTVTSVAIAGVAPVVVNSLPCAFNGKVLWPTTAAAGFLVSLVSATMVTASVSIGFLPVSLVAYGNFVMAANAANKVYFSNPGTETVWTIATDYFEVGDPGTVIAGMCVHQGSLYIATNIGMWVITGIPGETASLRQITTVPFTEPFSIDTSVVRTFGVQGAAVSEMSGTNQRALNYGLCPDGRAALTAGAGGGRVNTSIAFAFSDVGSITDEGGAVTDLGSTIWVLDYYNGQWARRQVSTAPVRMGSAQSSYNHLFYRAGSPDTEAIWMAPATAEDLVCNSDGSPASGTVKLAEYFHPMPFKVTEIIAEIDYGSLQTVFDTVAAGTAYLKADRSISVYVETPGVPVEATDSLIFSRSASSVRTQNLPSIAVAGSNYTRRRAFVRFAPSDGADTHVATPVVTLNGVKLRRLIMRCKEV